MCEKIEKGWLKLTKIKLEKKAVLRDQFEYSETKTWSPQKIATSPSQIGTGSTVTQTAGSSTGIPTPAITFVWDGTVVVDALKVSVAR